MTQTKAQLIDGKSAEIEFTGGSASAPAISFTGDTNTGIYSPGADQVAISTNGTGRLFIDANGNVGVGVNASAWGGDWKAIEFSNGHSFGSAGVQTGIAQNLYNNGTSWIYKTSAAASFYQLNAGENIWYTAASGTAGNAASLSERMRLDSSGRLGLGTSDPGSYLSGSNQLVLGSASTGAGITIFTPDSSAGSLTFAEGTGAADNARGQIKYFHNATGANGYMQFLVNTAPQMTITTTGVGVGSTAPGAPLTIGSIGYSTTDRASALRLLDVGGTNGNNYGFGIDNTVGGFYRTAGTGGFHAWLTANTERARIDSSGRLLVGTSSGSALLQVNGTFRAGSQASSGLDGNNAVILSATPPSGTLAAEIHCFGKDYATAGANNHTGLLIAYWSADTNQITTTTDINHSTGSNQGFQVIWSSPNLIVRNKTSMSAGQSSRAWIRWLA